jgi:hypothetical protein
VAKKHLRQQFDWVQSLIETPDGGYILAGSSHSNISGKKVKIQEAWEILGFKIDNSGTIVWQNN